MCFFVGHKYFNIMNKKFFVSALFLLLTFVFLSACKSKEISVSVLLQNVNRSVPSIFYRDMVDLLNNEKYLAHRAEMSDSLYAIALKNEWIPLVFADTAVFLYKHNGAPDTDIRIMGDLNGWSLNREPQVVLHAFTDTGLFYGIYKAPSTSTRVDYKIRVGSNFILDPGNKRLAWGGFGSNSELALSAYVASPWPIERSNTAKGSMSDNITLKSDALGYDVNIKVYLPNAYDNTKTYPLLVTTDGHEYSNSRLGAVNVVADNMINDNLITPLIIVFVDPRDPKSAQNKRQTEYVANDKFVQFLGVELLQYLENNYAVTTQANQRAILGTSLGGLNSAYCGVKSPTSYGLLAIQSPAFWIYPEIIDLYRNASTQNLKIYMDTGNIYDTEVMARNMQAVLNDKAYPLHYAEYSEGHSWANWRARIDDILLYFFRK